MTPIFVFASKEQAEKILKKHLSASFFGFKINNIFSRSYVATDPKDKECFGYVTLKTMTGKTIEFRFYRKGHQVETVSCTGFGSIRYDIDKPMELYPPLGEFLKKEGIKARDDFWAGAEI